jgi:excisionase family DNA binding protein
VTGTGTRRTPLNDSGRGTYEAAPKIPPIELPSIPGLDQTRFAQFTALALRLGVRELSAYLADNRIPGGLELLVLEAASVMSGHESSRVATDEDLLDPDQVLAYTIPKAAKALMMSESSLRRAIDAGEIRVARIGGLVRVTRDDLLAYLARHMDQAA